MIKFTNGLVLDKDFNIMFGDREEAILEFISSLVNGKRVHELLMLKCILNNEKIDGKETFPVINKTTKNKCSYCEKEAQYQVEMT